MLEESTVVPEISVDQLAHAHAAGGTVLDVREPVEFAAGHVPRARLLPLATVPVRLHEVPRAEPVYVVCQSGGRSARAVALLREHGVDARSVAGGTGAWIRSGRPVETGPPRGTSWPP